MAGQANSDHMVFISILVSSRLLSSRLVSSPLLSSPLVSSPVVSSRLLSSRLVSSRLVSSRLVSSPLVSSRLLSSRLLSLVSSHLVSSHWHNTTYVSLGYNLGLVAYECHHYSLLTERDRNINFEQVLGKCDKNLAEGWYRFSGAAGIQMPSSCPGPGRCNAEYSGWLYGAHPDQADGCVERLVCFGNYVTGCCAFKKKILVRDCGGYFVYKLGPAPGCNFRYCGKLGVTNGI